MSILGIDNRTENWKTASHFYPFFEQEASMRLARRLGESEETEPAEIHLELYWKGMRDYLHRNKVKDDGNDFAERYERLFPDLRSRIEGFGKPELHRASDSNRKFRDLNECNYDVRTRGGSTKLRNNLVNTEVDIVLKTPSNLFIGEAKHEMSFGADGSLVLVHQLVRQYVMARILVNLLQREEEVVPFVVGDKVEKLRKSYQVAFMIRQGWLKESNILEWRDVEALGRGS